MNRILLIVALWMFANTAFAEEVPQTGPTADEARRLNAMMSKIILYQSERVAVLDTVYEMSLRLQLRSEVMSFLMDKKTSASKDPKAHETAEELKRKLSREIAKLDREIKAKQADLQHINVSLPKKRQLRDALLLRAKSDSTVSIKATQSVQEASDLFSQQMKLEAEIDAAIELRASLQGSIVSLSNVK